MLILALAWPAYAGRDLVVFPPGLEHPHKALADVVFDPPLASDATWVAYPELGLPSEGLWIGPDAVLGGCAGAPGTQEELRHLVEIAVSHRNYGELDDSRRVFAEAEAMLPCAGEPIEAPTLWSLYFESAVLAAIEGDQARAVARFGLAVVAYPEGRWNETYNPTIKDLYLKGREASDTDAEVILQVVALTPRVGQVWVNGSRVAARADFTRAPTLAQVQLDGMWVDQLVTASGTPQLWLVPGVDVEQLVLAPRDLRQARAGAVVLGALRDEERIVVIDVPAGKARVYTDELADPLQVDLPVKEAPVVGAPTGPRVRALAGGLVQPGWDRGEAMGSLLVGSRVPIGPVIADVSALLGLGPLSQDQVVVFPVFRAGAGLGWSAAGLEWEGLALLTVGLHQERPPGLGPAAALGLRRPLDGRWSLEAELVAGYNLEPLFLGHLGASLSL